MIQQENSHQQNQTSKYRHCQIGIRSPQRRPVFLLCHPYIGSKRHNLKKEKSGIQIRRQKHSQRRSQRPQQKQIIAVPIMMPHHILPGKNRCHHPHKSRHTAVYRPEAVHCKTKSQAADFRDFQVQSRPVSAQSACRPRKCRQLQRHHRRHCKFRH